MNDGSENETRSRLKQVPKLIIIIIISLTYTLLAASLQAQAKESIQSCLVRTLQTLLGRKSGIGAIARVKSEWNSVPLRSLRSIRSEPNAVIRFAAGHGTKSDVVLFGRLETTEIIPNYRVLKITDSQGRVHLVDSDMVHIKSAHLGPENIEPELNAALRKFDRKTTIHLDDARLKPHLCGEFSSQTRSPGFKQLERIVEKNFRPSRLQDPSLRVMRCLQGVMTASFIQMTSSISRAMAPNGSWYHDHSSNFIYSIGPDVKIS
jgi:hypothetical protein